MLPLVKAAANGGFAPKLSIVWVSIILKRIFEGAAFNQNRDIFSHV